jgi:hypothetical protein
MSSESPSTVACRFGRCTGPSPTAARVAVAALGSRMTSGAAVLVGGTLCVPPELLAALHAELQAPRQRPPMGVVQPHRTPQMVALIDTVLTGAIAHRKRLRESCESFATLAHSQAVTPLDTSVVAGIPSDGEVVGVAVVAEMLEKSKPWVRELARNGALPGARKVRGVGNGRGAAHEHWCIPLASAHAYLADRQVT